MANQFAYIRTLTTIEVREIKLEALRESIECSLGFDLILILE